MECDSENRYVVTGSCYGDVVFWEVIGGSLEVISKNYDPNQSEILDIYVESETQITAVAYRNGQITVFNMTNGGIIMKFTHPQNYKVDKVLIALNPMPLIVFHSSKDDILYCYTLNGQY